MYIIKRDVPITRVSPLGKRSFEKILAVRDEMSKLGAHAMVVSVLDEIACKLLLISYSVSL